MATLSTPPSPWRRHRVLVTGATGLVGGAVATELQRAGAEVVVIVRDDDPQSVLVGSGAYTRCSVVRGDMTAVDVIERALVAHEVRTVLHLGAQTQVVVARDMPFESFQSNIMGTTAVLEACRRHREQIQAIVCASSDKAYGDAPLPYTEATPLLGSFPYDASKAAGELVCTSYAESYGLPVVVARCGNIYGAGDLNWSRLIPGTIRSFLDGERPIIRSNGTLTRDYLHVDDAADAYLRLALFARGLDRQSPRHMSVADRAFNFSAERPLAVMEVVEAIRVALDVDITADIRANATHEIAHQHLSSEKARNVLGWSARVDLQAGLSRTIPWYRAIHQLHDRNAGALS